MAAFSKILIYLTLAIPVSIKATAQYTDTVLQHQPVPVQLKNIKPYRPSNLSLITNGAMIGYGLLSLKNHELIEINNEVKEETWTEMLHSRYHLDNILQFLPAATVYGLNMAGIHGQHNFRDRTALFLFSSVLSNATVYTLKTTTHEMRPDGSDRNSFPSGHTAQAFASAEFLRLEYKNVSPWYGVAGYITAAATGALRVYNNKHWISDVVAGAGIGILSAEFTYWIYPKIEKKLFHKHREESRVVSPEL